MPSIGIVSGKGGVGKSLVTSMLAVTFNRLGKSTAVLDADITGPSIPKAFYQKKTISFLQHTVHRRRSRMTVSAECHPKSVTIREH